MSFQLYATLFTAAYEDKVLSLLVRAGYTINQVYSDKPTESSVGQIGSVLALNLDHSDDYELEEDVEVDDYEIDWMLSDVAAIFKKNSIKYYSLILHDDDVAGSVRWRDTNIDMDVLFPSTNVEVPFAGANGPIGPSGSAS